jgi:drug/metabolite transporter (DMT)-like permease
MKPVLIEQPRGFQLFVGVAATVAAVVSAIAGILYLTNLERPLSLLAVGAAFFLLVTFFATVAYRLIKNRRREDGGLLPRWAILLGSFLFSAYFVIYVAFPEERTFVQLALAALGIPLFAWVGIRTFKGRRRDPNEI